MSRSRFFEASVFFFLIFLLASPGIPAQSSQALLLPGEEVYSLLYNLSVCQGILPLSLDAPQSRERLGRAATQALAAASSATTDSSPEQGVHPRDSALFSSLKPATDPILSALKLSGPVPASLEAALILSPEFYAALPGTLIPPFFASASRSPLASIPLQLGIADSLSLASDFRLGLNPDSLNPALYPHSWTNIPLDPSALDYRFPSHSSVNLGSSFWSLRAARGPLDWGPAAKNLYLASTAGFFDYVYGDIALSDFSYSFFAASLDSTLEGGKSAPTGASYADMPRSLFLHRFQARAFKRLRIALMEGSLVAGVNPDLRYLNPLAVFHSFYDFSNATSYLGAELEFLPWKYASLYASAVANQFSSAYERQRYPGVAIMPDAFAWQAGIRTALPLGSGYLEARAEHSYANPWIYIREYPQLSYSNEHYLCSNLPGSSQYDFPCVGFEPGPDSLLSLLEAGYRLPGILHGLVGIEYLQKGQNYLNSPYQESLEAAALQSPSGISQNSLRLRAQATWRLLPSMSVKAGLAGIWVWNQGHQSGAFAADIQGLGGIELDILSLIALIP